MVKLKLKHKIVELYNFQYEGKDYSVYIINNVLHVAYNMNNKKAFCSIFCCNLIDKRGIADTLEMFSYPNSNIQIEYKKLNISNIDYWVQSVDKSDRILSLSTHSEFILDKNDSDSIYVEELSCSKYNIDRELYSRLNYIVIISIIIWLNMSSNLLDIYESSSSGFEDECNIITIQPDSCIYRYCIIPISDTDLTLNVVGNSPYNTNLITDYQSDGVYEMKNVRVCTIVNQLLIKKDLIISIHDKIKTIFEE